MWERDEAWERDEVWERGSVWDEVWERGVVWEISGVVRGRERGREVEGHVQKLV